MRSELLSRRQVLAGRSVAKAFGISPPASSAEGLEACTGCGLCAEQCPRGIIRLIDGLPSIDFALSECTFCGECRAACPEPVFRLDGPVRFHHVAVITDVCLAKRGVACQSCGESCPEEAIRFRAHVGSPFVPELNEEMCSGCGACLRVCPVGAITHRLRAAEAENA